jgi:excisionase family DNA binding protein
MTQQSMSAPIGVNQTEAARLLGVTDRTLRNWERSGRLRAAKVGRLRLYPVESLRRLVGEGTVPSAK